MLVIAGARRGPLERRETAEQGRAAFGMKFGREGIARAPGGIEPEHLEEGFIGVGQPAGSVAAENGVALRVHQALVAQLALIEPCIHGRGIAQAASAVPADPQFGGLTRQKFVTFACGQKIGDQEGECDRSEARQSSPA